MVILDESSLVCHTVSPRCHVKSIISSKPIVDLVQWHSAAFSMDAHWDPSLESSPFMDIYIVIAGLIRVTGA